MSILSSYLSAIYIDQFTTVDSLELSRRWKYQLLRFFGYTCLLSFSFLQAEAPIPLSLTELSKEGNRWLNSPDQQEAPLGTSYHEKVVEVRGFLLQQGLQWFLFTQPVLRSCCMGKKEYLASKLYVDGTFDRIQPGRVYTVTGKLIIRPTCNEQGEFTALYHLENATLGGL